MSDAQLVREEERDILRAVFVANESSGVLPTIRALRTTMDKAARRTIESLVDRGLIRADGVNYRLSLAGLYAADFDGARQCISLFNIALPALQELWRQGATDCSIGDLARLVERTQPVVEHDLKRALWYVLPDLGGASLGGWNYGPPGMGEIASLTLRDPILDLEPLPLVRIPAPESAARETRDVKEREVEPALGRDLAGRKEGPSQRGTGAIELCLEGLHPEVVEASGRLFMDGHYTEAIFNAFKAVEVQVRDLSGLESTGQDLMAKAFNEAAPKISVAVEEGLSGEDEQRGFKFLFMGAMAGIRNPKGHGFVQQRDPQKTLEYLAFASLLMRRLDDARISKARGRRGGRPRRRRV